MGEIIGIINQKGGVSKTTTSLSLWTGLPKLKGLKTICIDLDPQCNLTVSGGARMDNATILDVLLEKNSIKNAVQHTRLGDIIASHKGLSGLEVLLTQIGREYKLKNALKLLTDYDVIILDTPPSLGILTINALTASTSVIIPANADFFSMYGISQLGETIKSVKEYTNPNLKVGGVLLTRYTDRTVLSRDMAENIKKLAERLNTKVFQTKIREAVSVREAQVSQQSIFDYAPQAKVTQDYKNFINELWVDKK